MRRVLLYTYLSHQSSFEFFDLFVTVSCAGKSSVQRISWFDRTVPKVWNERGIFVVEGEKDAAVDLQVKLVPYDSGTRQVTQPGEVRTARTYQCPLADLATLDGELILGHGIVLRLRQELADCSRIRLAPALPEPREDMQVSGPSLEDTEIVDVAVDSMGGSSSTGGHSTIDVIERYLCQPGTYSGDAWHIAAALLYDPELKLVVPRPPILAWRIDVQEVAIDATAWEIQLRSSLGISKFITSADGTPQTFFFAGDLEIWMRAWRIIPDPFIVDRMNLQTPRQDHVIEFFKAWSLGPLQSGVRQTISRQLAPDHLMTLSAYQHYDDEGIPLPDHLRGNLPVQITLATSCVAEDIQELHPEISGQFALENLQSLLAKTAKKPVQECLKNLFPSWRKDGLESLLEDALVFADYMPWRLLSKNLRRSIQRRLCSAIRNSLHKYITGETLRDRFESLTPERLEETAGTIETELLNAIKRKNESRSGVKHLTKSNQFLDFYTDCGIPNLDDRLITAFFTYDPRQGRQLFSIGREMVGRITGGAPFCGMTFAATSVLMSQIEERGLGAVRGELRETFTQGLSVRSRRQVEEKVSIISGLGGPCLILNTRLGGYHPEHDVTEGIFRQLQRFVRRHDWTLVCTQQPPVEWRWRKGIKRAVLDIYSNPDIGAKMALEVDMRETAYLWKCVAGLGNVIGVVGGMSGSLDIAAYMGVRTFCWDIPLGDRKECNLKNRAEYQDCIRLLLSYPLMSIGLREIAERVNDQGELKPDKDLLFPLDEVALTLWAGGYDVIPGVTSELFNPTSVQTLDKEFSEAFEAVLFYDLPLIRQNILNAEEV